jgi:hypothetical protein
MQLTWKTSVGEADQMTAIPARRCSTHEPSDLSRAPSWLEAILQKRGIAIVPGAGDRGGDPRSLGHRGQQLVEAA